MAGGESFGQRAGIAASSRRLRGLLSQSIPWGISWSLEGGALRLSSRQPEGKGLQRDWGAGDTGPPPPVRTRPRRGPAPRRQRLTAERGGTSPAAGSPFSPLPRQRARLVSLQSCGGGRAGFHGGAVRWGFPRRRGDWRGAAVGCRTPCRACGAPFRSKRSWRWREAREAIVTALKLLALSPAVRP